LLRLHNGNGHRGIGLWHFVRDIIWIHLQPAAGSVLVVGQPVNGQTQARQHIVIDDGVQKYSLRIERFLLEDDAFAE
jgi:hypothetical protein